MLDLKDKLNLLWKFLFLAVFTYGVVMVTCCKNDCSSSSAATSQCCKKDIAQIDKKPCGSK